ncbi:MAG: aspartate aminotransferase family protein [Caldilineae bacterium]|nr:MAG: aspartate aminotransferase family protein [Caldilineae bacterium]
MSSSFVSTSATLAAADIVALESTHSAGVTARRPLTIVRGEAAYVWDEAGNRYIDCIAGHGALNVGHCHPAVVAAIEEQSRRLMICPTSLYNDRRAQLLSRLTKLAPEGMKRAFLCNSGTEAVEAAIKFARLSTGRPGIVAARMAFHGRTLGSLSATWKPQYRRPFEPLVPGFRHVRLNRLEELDEAVDETTAAVLLEVVQGEGGVVPAGREYLQGAQALCRERGALLILDEVQTGVGRTGSWWACQQMDVTPDLMPVAKSLAGGFPMGACLIGDRVGRLPAGSHGSTFGGNPLACAAALATLDVVEREDLPGRARRLGEMFHRRLAAIDSPLVREVRGLGLMVGVDLRIKATPVLKGLQERGVLALPAGPTVVRFLPPLVIEEPDLEEVVAALADVLASAET